MKNKALKISLFIVTVPAIFTGCVDTKSLEAKQEVIFNDGGSVAENGRQVIVIEENSIKIAERKIKSFADNRDPKVKTNDDGSQTTTTFDGYGNKSDSRCFKGNAILKCVVVETSFDGKTEIIAYGKNGEIKSLGVDKIENVLDAPANEIVNTAGFSAESVKADIGKLLPSKKSEANITPPPISEFPVSPNQVQTAPLTETIQNDQELSESESVETEDREN